MNDVLTDVWSNVSGGSPERGAKLIRPNRQEAVA